MPLCACSPSPVLVQVASLSRTEAAACLLSSLLHVIRWLDGGCISPAAAATPDAKPASESMETELEAEAGLHLERIALLGVLLVAQHQAEIAAAAATASALDPDRCALYCTAAPSALAPLVSLLKARRAHFELQCEGCAALVNYLHGGSVAAATAVVRAGGVKALLFAMRSHIKKEQVQEHAVHALRLLCVGAVMPGSTVAAVSTEAALAANQTAVVSANGVAMLTAVLKRYDASASIQHNGCATLGAIALGSKAGLEALAMASEGVEALINSLRCCADAEGDAHVPAAAFALEMGRTALRTLFWLKSSELCQRIERANGKRFL